MWLQKARYNVYKVVTLSEKINLVLLLKYLDTCDHFVYIMHYGVKSRRFKYKNNNRNVFYKKKNTIYKI